MQIYIKSNRVLYWVCQHVIHRAAYHSPSGATKWWNKHIGAPDYLQAPLSNLWRLTTEVVSFSSSIITSDRQDAPSALGVSCCSRACLPSRDTATPARGHSCHTCPALADPSLGARPHDRRRCEDSARQLPTLTPLRNGPIVVCLFSAL